MNRFTRPKDRRLRRQIVSTADPEAVKTMQLFVRSLLLNVISVVERAFSRKSAQGRLYSISLASGRAVLPVDDLLNVAEVDYTA
jgi:hypothetical protein